MIFISWQRSGSIRSRTAELQAELTGLTEAASAILPTRNRQHRVVIASESSDVRQVNALFVSLQVFIPTARTLTNPPRQ
jgi:hypothetical protein